MARRADPERMAQKRERIAVAAGKSFAAQGYDRTSVAQVARSAGTSPTSVFYYFSDKSALFRTVFERDLPAAEALIAAHADDTDPTAGILAVLDALAADAAEPNATGSAPHRAGLPHPAGGGVVITEPGERIAVPKRWLFGVCLAGAVLGCFAAFVVDPVVALLLALAEDAPGPLRPAAGLPTAWAVPLGTPAGPGGGCWYAREWRNDNGTLAITSDGVTVDRVGLRRYVPRRLVRGVFTDGRELVLLDHRTSELLRVEVDPVLVAALEKGFRRAGPSWQGTADSYDAEFVVWVDDCGEPEPRADEVLRSRQRALADKRFGAAARACDRLRDLGLVVRDRAGSQQYQVVPPAG